MRIKTRESAAGYHESPQTAIRQRFQRTASPSNPAQAVSEKRPHLRTEPPAIKTRESVRQNVHDHGDTVLPDVEFLVPDWSSPRSKLQEIRQILRRRMSPPPRQRQEATSLQPLQPQPQQIPSSENVFTEIPIRQQAPAVKTKEVCLRREVVSPAESPAQARTQGGRKLIREQGRKEAVRRTKARQMEVQRSRGKGAAVTKADGGKPVLQSGAVGQSPRPPAPDVPSFSSPSQSLESPGAASIRAEGPAKRAAKKATSKREKAVKASRAGIKNSRQAVKAEDRSAASAQAPYPSPRRKRQGSLISLRLLSPRDPLRWARAGSCRKPAERLRQEKEEQGSV